MALLKVGSAEQATNKSAERGDGRHNGYKGGVLRDGSLTRAWTRPLRRALLRLVLLLAAWGRHASAEVLGPAGVSLEWSTAEAGPCPDRSYVLRELNRYLSRSTAPTELRATGQVTAQPGGRYRLVLTTRLNDTHGERVFEDASCAAVTDAVVVVLAWMVDPEVMLGSSSQAPEPPPRARPPAPKLAPKPERELAVVVGLGAQVDTGSLPSAGFGAELRAGAWLRRVQLAAFAGGFLRQDATIAERVSDGTPLGGQFALLALGVEACPSLDVPGALRLMACAGPELDWLRATGLGVTTPTRAEKAWAALRLGGSAALALSQEVSLVLGVRAIIPSRREYFALHNVGVVHRASPVSLRGSLAVELAF